jgi:hypothetical protein
MSFHASFACPFEHIMHGLVYVHVYLIPIFCVHYDMFVNNSNTGWVCKGCW